MVMLIGAVVYSVVIEGNLYEKINIFAFIITNHVEARACNRFTTGAPVYKPERFMGGDSYSSHGQSGNFHE